MPVGAPLSACNARLSIFRSQQRARSRASMEPPAARQVAPDGWLATASKCEHCSHFAAHRDSTLYPGLREPASEGECLRIPRLTAGRCLSSVPLKSMAACGASCTHRTPTDSSDSVLVPQVVQIKMPPSSRWKRQGGEPVHELTRSPASCKLLRMYDRALDAVTELIRLR